MGRVGVRKRADHEWQSAEKVHTYLAHSANNTQRAHGEETLLARLPRNLSRVLDLGTGDGRLLALVRGGNPGSEGVGLDFSDTMLSAAAARFSEEPLVKLRMHDLRLPLPGDLGRFDAVVSSFAIHHLGHAQKRRLYEEVFDVLVPGGVFCNLEHVAPPTARRHDVFLKAMGLTQETEDRSNRLLDVETQLGWLWDIGYTDVDCDWKWLELALLAGTKPERGRRSRAGGAHEGQLK